MAQRKINLLSKRDRKILPEDLFSTQATRVQRAGEILEDEFNLFVQEMIAKSADPENSPVRDWVVEVEKTPVASFRGGVVYSYEVFIDNIVFGILSEGTENQPYPRYAAKYGLRAFPMYNPRSVKFGNRPMSQPDSLSLVKAKSKEDIAWTTVIRHPIKARNFTKLIYERAQKKIDREDLRIQLELTDR